MKWSWHVGRIAGIDIRVHATFPLLFAWIALIAVRGGATPAAVLGAVVLTLAVFVLVVLHECAHALTARRFGIHTRDITLLPIGGIARLERMPREPRQELLVALAGPAVNVVLAIILYATLALSGDLAQLRELNEAGTTTTTSAAAALAQLFAVNVSLALFNLLPAFPLDGGRALRALLAMRGGDYVKATVTAARVGRAFALLFGLVGLFVISSPMLVIISLFIWLSAASEATAAQTAAALADVPLASLLITDVRTLAPHDPLSRAAELTIQGYQQDFPVIDDGTLVGMLGRADLVRGLANHGTGGTVGSAMRRDFHSATPDDTPEEGLKELATGGGASLPVVRDGELVGLLTAENVMEFLMLKGALGSVAAR
ncbi:MAG TPA: site-2 protease family protein [Gemmatimonadaceae bacterium]